jgi:hypothetical protein
MQEHNSHSLELLAKVEELSRWLQSHGVSTERWGKGSAKTIQHLASELLEGESYLKVIDGVVVRICEGVKIDVRYRGKSGELQLIEEKQVFRDGRERRRGLIGVNEKRKPGESILTVGERAIQEELNLHEKVNLGVPSLEHLNGESTSYPGLFTMYTTHTFITYLPEWFFRPEGYVEVQPDKSTYFVWKEVASDA